MHEWLTTWRDVATEGGGPFLHDRDSGLKRHVAQGRWEALTSLDDYQKRYPYPGASRTVFHLGLLPVPYLGDVQRAKVILLMLNPGFRPMDYFLEADPDIRNVVRRNLHQEGLEQAQYPFWCLDPSLSHHTGFHYWTKKGRFGWMIEKLAGPDPSDYTRAMQRISNAVAVIQYVPYRSSQFSVTKGVEQEIGSTKLAKDFVQHLHDEAGEERFIMAIRKAREWGISPDDKTVMDANARGGWFGQGSDVGERILEHIERFA